MIGDTGAWLFNFEMGAPVVMFVNSSAMKGP